MNEMLYRRTTANGQKRTLHSTDSYFEMPFLKLILAVLIATLPMYAGAEEPAVPNAIAVLSKKYNLEIKEYQYKSQRVYLIDNRNECCDLGQTLYDGNAEVLCRYSGFAPAWEHKCSDFDDEAKLIKIIDAD